MNTISFGKSRLEYTIRLSAKAKKKRIEITPFSIEIIAPDSASEGEILSFIQKKSKDVFVAQEKLKLKNRTLLKEKDQYFSGGKISFRGRRIGVKVELSKVERSEVIFKNKFILKIPATLAEDKRELEVKSAIQKWLESRLYSDSLEIARTLGAKKNLSFAKVRVRHQKNIWATCGKDKILYINALLIKHPRKVLEYVIAHELAHLKHRNHSPAFWSLVAGMIPEYKKLQSILDQSNL